MTNDELRAVQIKEYTRCKSDAQYFIHNYCWTFNAKETDPTKPKIFKMKPYPHLVDLIKHLEAAIKDKQPLIIEKSREMCISWTIMAWQLHKVMFTEGWMSLNISRKESEVEDTGKTPKSLFGRLDFMYKHLPSFLRMRAENPFLTFKVQSNNSYIKEYEDRMVYRMTEHVFQRQIREISLSSRTFHNLLRVLSRYLPLSC